MVMHIKLMLWCVQLHSYYIAVQEAGHAKHCISIGLYGKNERLADMIKVTLGIRCKGLQSGISYKASQVWQVSEGVLARFPVWFSSMNMFAQSFANHKARMLLYIYPYINLRLYRMNITHDL